MVEFVEAPHSRGIYRGTSPMMISPLCSSSWLRTRRLGDVMPGTGGFRKLRWADERRGKGRRGGLRIIYYLLVSDEQIWLFTLFGKDEAADLTPDQKRLLRTAIEAERRSRDNARRKKPRG